MKFKYAVLMLAMALFATLIFSGCFATSTTKAAPPMVNRTGEAPTAAFLPFINTYEPETAAFVSKHLEACLADRKVFRFVPKSEVNAAVAGVDLDKMFGLKASQYAAIGRKLNADYVIHGTMAVRKTLKFTGWRKDVDVSARVYDGRTGAKVDSWRSMTDFATTSAKTELSAEEMAASAANHTCAKMMERAF
ncbi:MAG TPA: hypothetical protein DHV36_15945 [Desulfobacteraceae bacterium]|nr:hypothetical protein [Desulfobacteraceae bacterium]|tara:strand:- start:1092 stop:1667 length:576 start_codon:yes stop_codon:yes gene_type:complete